MPKFNLISTNFTGGELSPELAKGRVDIAKYNNGAATIENCTITIAGGVKRRPGSRFVYIEDNASIVRLTDFIYNRAQAYAMAMVGKAGQSIAHFYQQGAIVLNGMTPVSVNIPYSTSQIPSVNFVQKADTAFMTHEAVYPQRLQRYSATQWSMVNTPFITPAFEEQGHNPAATLTLGSAAVGTGITANASASAFLKTDVGRHIAYGGGYALVKTYVSATQVTVDIVSPFPSTSVPSTQWNLEGSPQGDVCASNKGRPGQAVSLQANFQYFDPSKSISGFIGGNGTALISCTGHGYSTGDTVRVMVGGTSFMGSIIVVDSNTFGIAAPEISGQIATSGSCARATIVTGSELFRAVDVGSYVNLNGGLIRIDQVVSVELARGTVLRELNSDIPAGANAWTLEQPAWTASKGYPRAVSISKQRLLFAGSPGYPQHLWASGIAQYLSFQFGTNDDDAFRFELDGPRNSPILHIAPARQLVVLTEADEMSVKGGQEKAVNPTNIQKTDESTSGANYVRPVKVGNELIFVQAAGKRVMSAAYRFDIDGFSTADRTVFSSHITAPGVIQLAHQKDPDSQLFAVRADGQLAVCAYDIDQEVTGWGRWVTQGAYKSACVIPTTSGEEVYTAVLRSLWNGSAFVDRWVVEVMDPDMLVDCGVHGTDVAGKATWNGLGHLEGKVVQCVADGAYMGTFTVAGGQITLPREANDVQIGLAFTSTIEMLQPEVGGGGQTAQGSPVHVNEVVVRTLSTRGVEVNGKPIDPRRFGPNLLDQPPPEFSRDVRAITLQDEIYKAKVVIQQSYPLPFHVLNVVRSVTVNAG